MMFAKALVDQSKTREEIAALAPEHLVLVDAYLVYSESLPRNTLPMFLNRVADVLQLPTSQTRSIDLSFMDFRVEDFPVLERILALPSVRYIDIRRGNFRLHTKEALRMIHEFISGPRSSVVRVYIYLSELPDDLRSSSKFRCADDEECFEKLLQREAHPLDDSGKKNRSGSPLRRNPAKPASESSESVKAPENMQDAIAVFRRHGLTPIQMFDTPETIDAILKELEVSRKDDWRQIVAASHLIHHVLPMSVVKWAKKTLTNAGLWTSVYNKRKLENYCESVQEKNDRARIERSVGVVRRHVGMVLQEIGFNESEAQTKMDSLRKRVESYKASRRWDDADELEEVMELVIDWRPDCGSTCTEVKEPKKVDYQVVRRVR